MKILKKFVLPKDVKKGLILCILIGAIGNILSKFIPFIGSTSLAILVGILLGNTIATDKSYLPGVKFSEKRVLSIAIMLLGASLKLTTITSLGIKGIIFILLIMSFAITINYFIGKALGFSRNFSLLMGAGNAVCGSSAIVATAPILEAKEDEIGIPIAVVNLIGTIFMFILPFLAFKVFNLSPIQSGGLIGGGLQSVGQVVAGGNFLGDEIGKLSILFKMIRISLLGGVILVFSFINKGNKDSNSPKKFKFSIPPFIIGFFILSLLVTVGLINNSLQGILKDISHSLLLIGMAAIGMRVKFKEILSEGPRAILFGSISMIFQISFILVLVKIIF